MRLLSDFSVIFTKCAEEPFRCTGWQDNIATKLPPVAAFRCTGWQHFIAASSSYRFGIRPPVVSRIELRLVLLDKAEVFGCWKAFEDRSISACGFILSLVAERGPEKAPRQRFDPVSRHHLASV